MLPVAILAGGLSTRLRPLTEKIPKSLIEVNGEPFIAHQLRLLRANGVRRVVLCVGHLGEMIRDVLKDGSAYGVEVDYAFDGASLLGTAGAVKNALPKLGDVFLRSLWRFLSRLRLRCCRPKLFFVWKTGLDDGISQ